MKTVNAKYELHVRYPNGETGHITIPKAKVERKTARAMEKAINHRAKVEGFTSIEMVEIEEKDYFQQCWKCGKTDDIRKRENKIYCNHCLELQKHDPNLKGLAVYDE